MSKSLSASKHLMQTYLTELLSEDVNEFPVVKVKEKQVQPIEKLLSKINLPEVAESHNVKLKNTIIADESQTKLNTKTVTAKIVTEKQQSVELNQTVKKHLALKNISPQKNTESVPERKLKNYRQGDFQAIFFKVAGLTIAVPLIELGGIHNSAVTTALMGKPDWFKGVMLHRNEKVNVVDTARWVMPEKCNDALISSLNYQYIIMLNNSNWGMMAESLIDTAMLTQEDVKWLDTGNKRPWLAGLVKNRMCALLDVDSLITLLNKGVNISQE